MGVEAFSTFVAVICHNFAKKVRSINCLEKKSGLHVKFFNVSVLYYFTGCAYTCVCLRINEKPSKIT